VSLGLQTREVINTGYRPTHKHDRLRAATSIVNSTEIGSSIEAINNEQRVEPFRPWTTIGMKMLSLKVLESRAGSVLTMSGSGPELFRVPPSSSVSDPTSCQRYNRYSTPREVPVPRAAGIKFEIVAHMAGPGPSESPPAAVCRPFVHPLPLVTGKSLALSHSTIISLPSLA